MKKENMNYISEKINNILSEYDTPLTLRQLFYRLVSIGELENNENSYKDLSKVLTKLRAEGLVPWDKITDLKKQPEKKSSWKNPESFFRSVSWSYKRSLQQGQPRKIEVWCEKAIAISHITNKYDVVLLAGGGYKSNSALYEARERFNEHDEPNLILYIGDFDPSGIDIQRSIKINMMNFFDMEMDVQRVLLTLKDIEDYKLNPNPVKLSDSRASEFIKKYGRNTYELDALPPDIIAKKLEEAICRNMDMKLYKEQLQEQKEDNVEIASFIESWNLQQANYY